MKQYVALAPYEYEKVLSDELKALGAEILLEKDRLFWFESKEKPFFVQWLWENPQLMKIESVGDGVKKLKALLRNWGLYTVGNHRRAELLQSELPYYSRKKLKFLQEMPTAPMGGWTMLSPNEILYSTQTSSPFVDGEMHFEEDKLTPPNRAYLKLWEFFTLTGLKPKEGEHCLDMGSSPGGWSWVLQTLGANVSSVDRAPLAGHIANLPNIKCYEGNAFTFSPAEIPPVDWFFSDLICYPDKLYELVEKWSQDGGVKKFVCTIKLQGELDVKIIKKFLEIPGSQVMHLTHNKHELTWWKI